MNCKKYLSYCLIFLLLLLNYCYCVYSQLRWESWIYSAGSWENLQKTTYVAERFSFTYLPHCRFKPKIFSVSTIKTDEALRNNFTVCKSALQKNVSSPRSWEPEVLTDFKMQVWSRNCIFVEKFLLRTWSSLRC